MVTIGESPVRSAIIHTPKVLTNCNIVALGASRTRTRIATKRRASM